MPRPNADNWRGIRIGGPHHYAELPDGTLHQIGQQGKPLQLADLLSTPEQSTVATNDTSAERFGAADIGPRWLLVLRRNSPRIVQGSGAL